MNAKYLKASTFPNTEVNFVGFVRVRERLYVKYNIGLNWAYMKYKALVFNESVEVEDGFKASSR